MPRLRRIILQLVTGALAWNARAVAQDSASVQAAERPTAPVVIDGNTLFRVRGISAYPAERRAAEIADRIRAIAADRTIPVESLTVQHLQAGARIVAGGQPIMAIVDADAELEGVSREVLSEVYRPRIAEAIGSYRHAREAPVLGRAAVRAIGATIAVVLALWLLRRMRKWVHATLERRYKSRIRGVQIQTVEIVKAERLWRGLEQAVSVLTIMLAFLAVYLYLDYVLLLFPWTRAMGMNLAAMLLRPLETLAAGALRFLPDLVFLVILAVLTRYALRLVRLFFQAVSAGTAKLPGFEADWAAPTDRIVRLLVIAFALVMAYPYIPGSGSEAFKGLTLLFGLVFSLGSPSVIGNLVAGQSLAFRRAFKVGDRVKIGEHIGEVAQIRLLTTYLRSPKNEQIVIPNSLILNTDVVNFSALALDAGLILHTIVGIGYETPWRQVEAMLLEAAGAHRGSAEAAASRSSCRRRWGPSGWITRSTRTATIRALSFRSTPRFTGISWTSSTSTGSRS